MKEVCDLVGLTPRTVRYYEKEGLLPQAGRTVGNYRVFGVEDVADLLRIKRLKGLGFTLDQIRTILGKPASDKAKTALHELDAKLAQELVRIEDQRTAITEILRTGAPLDVVPEFAELFAQREGKMYSNEQEDARDKMRMEMIEAFGTEEERQRLLDILTMQADTPQDPLMVTLSDLDTRFAAVDDNTSETEAQDLIDAYVDALTTLYSRVTGGPLSRSSATRSTSLYEGLQAKIACQVMDEVMKRFDVSSIS